MQKIYLAKPGAQKEGPFTIEQINHDLATKKISDTDFWAWHEGLPAWTPLHSVPGVSAKAWVVTVPEVKPQRVTSNTSTESRARQPQPAPDTARSEAAPAAGAKSSSDGWEAKASTGLVSRPQPERAEARVAAAPVVALQPDRIWIETSRPPVATPRPETVEQEARTESKRPSAEASPRVEITAAPLPEPKPAAPATAAPLESLTALTTPSANGAPKSSELFAIPSMSSGKPFNALEQIFVFTTGDGPSAVKSEVTVAMLFEAVGRKWDEIRGRIPLDVIGGTGGAVLEAIRAGAIPGSAWRAMSKIRPSAAAQAHEGAYHLCVRTFPLESKDLVALFLLYNKQKL